jgi:hypothetical protein
MDTKKAVKMQVEGEFCWSSRRCFTVVSRPGNKRIFRNVVSLAYPARTGDTAKAAYSTTARSASGLPFDGFDRLTAGKLGATLDQHTAHMFISIAIIRNKLFI